MWSRGASEPKHICRRRNCPHDSYDFDRVACMSSLSSMCRLVGPFDLKHTKIERARVSWDKIAAAFHMQAENLPLA